MDHLEELRWRLIRIIVAVFVSAALALYFGEEIFRFAIRPLGDIQLHVTAITGSFYSYLTVSLFAGLFAVIPYVFYQLWGFVAPGLYKTERRAILPAVLASSVLFLLGAVFAFTLVIPFAIQYLVSFAGDVLTPIITVDSYLSFAGMMILSFGIGFNFPTVAFFLGKIGLVTADGLAKGRRLALVLIMIAAAILTPPDVFTQVLLGGPLYLLYELSIVLVRWTNPRDRV
ncbi:MAG TPA: twin-arginine translocase subunit TatC [candidate division Zixibacteria bacterium]|nr:twin-arginine translocase subunit TatC [candidate division Zixibacteria bacterium]